jgi:hypothetical protein
MTRKSRGKRIGLAADGDLTLAHRLEQGRLHLGRRAVDLVGKQQVVEDGAAIEAEAPVVRTIDLGPGQIRRQEIGGELDAVEIAFEPGGKLLDRRGLGQPGGALDQQMAVGEQGDEQPIDQAALTQDGLADLSSQCGKLGRE